MDDLEPLAPEPLDDPALPSPEQAQGGPPRRGSLRPGRVALAGLVAVAVAAAGFAIGVGHGGAPTVRMANAAIAGSPASGAMGVGGRAHLGKVTSVHGATFTVTTLRGTAITVNTSSSTTYDKVTTAKVADAAPGTRIVVRGTSSGTSPGASPGTSSGPFAIAATQIFIGLPSRPARTSRPSVPKVPSGPVPPGSAGPGFFGRGRRAGAFGLAAGTVKANDGHTVTLTRADGSTVTVTTGPSTTVYKRVTAGLADVTVNATVAIAGPTAANGTVSASHVEIAPTPGVLGPGFRRGFGPGSGPGFGVRRPGGFNGTTPGTNTPASSSGALA